MRSTLAVLFFAFISSAFAGPGAHGPGGEHLDAPGGHAHGAAAAPSLEAKSELFELVARLERGELSVLVDRFETNEPVLGGQLEVARGNVKAKAKFHADHGDYAIDDAAFLKVIAQPGDHPLIFTLVAGNESDLLEGVLRVAAPPAEAHSHLGERVAIGAAAVLAIGALAFALLRRRRARASLAMLLVLFIAAPWVLAGPGAHGPGGEHLDVPGATVEASGLRRLPDGSVNVPKLAQRRMEIRTVLAPETEAAATVELPGKVVMDPNAGGRVQPSHGGRVEPGPQGLPVIGKAVRKGEVLAYVRHHAEPITLANQRSQAAELRAAREVAEQRVKRLEALEGTVPRKDLDAARVEAASLGQRERTVSASLSTPEALVAPVAGVIARADVVSGQVVEARDVLFEIVDPRRALVEATAIDATLGRRIASASVREAPSAKLSFAGTAASLRDGALPILFRVAAEAEAPPLSIGQPVTVVAQLSEKTRGIVLPAAALVRNASNEPVVWIKVGAERFVPQPVQHASLDAATIVVTKGLSPDNRVVVQGASLIAQIR
jgi:cobalt-zinc-cadmium efflux system membrane fusion protein